MSTGAAGSGSGLSLSLDGRLARMMLTILQHVESSALMLVCLTPAMAFHALVGWQPTHLALWLGTASLLPSGPALYALASVSGDFLREGGYPGHGIRRFFAAFGHGARALAGWWGLAALLTLVLAYNAALYGASDAVFLAVVAGLATLFVVSLAMCLAALAHPNTGWLALMSAVVRSAAVRPHVPLAWAFIGAAVAAAPFLPVVGSSLMLLLPGLAATAVLIVNAATGYDAATQRQIGHSLAP